MRLGSLNFRCLAGVAIAAVVLAACGDGDDSANSQTDGAVAKQDRPRDPSPKGKGNAGRGERGDDGGGRGDPGAARAPGGTALTGDVEQARAGMRTVDRVYEDFGVAVAAGVAADDAPPRAVLDDATDNAALTSVCDLMSEQAKRQTVVYAKRSSGLADVEWTCESATALLLRRSGQTAARRASRAEVVGVNANGDRATASIRFGGKGPITTVPLVREDGAWKLAASPSGGR